MKTQEQEKAQNMSDTVDKLVASLELYKDKFQELEDTCLAHEKLAAMYISENNALKDFINTLKKLSDKCEPGSSLGADTINVININKIMKLLNGLDL